MICLDIHGLSHEVEKMSNKIVLIKTRTYETSQSCARVHLGHLKKKHFKKTTNKDVRTSQSCNHVHLGTSAIQVNERDTGEQAKKIFFFFFF